MEEEVKKEETKKEEKIETKYELHLYSDAYKGSGKCWVAKVDKYKKIIGFVKPYSVVWIDKYRKKKIFFLEDGLYFSCEVGTKTTDNREYFKIENGTKTNF